jgi:Flp pilus assembly protein TadD
MMMRTFFLSLLFVLLALPAAAADGSLRDVLLELDETLDAVTPGQEALSKALDRSTAALSDHPQSVPLMLRQAIAAARLGNHARARKSVAAIIAMEPENAHALALRGAIAWQEGDVRRADTDFARVLLLKPRHPVANDFEAFKAIRAGKFKEAVAAARKALVGNPRDLNAYTLLAYAYHKMGEEDMARLVALSAMEISDKFADTYNTLGLIEFADDKMAQAGRQFSKALELDPKHNAARLNLAALSLAVSDHESALSDLDKVKARDPKNIWALISRGVALRGLNRFDDADKAFKEALKVDADNPEARYNLCVLKQEYQQSFDEALKWCQDYAKRISPRHKKAKEMKNRVQGIRTTIDLMREAAEEEAREKADAAARQKMAPPPREVPPKEAPPEAPPAEKAPPEAPPAEKAPAKDGAAAGEKTETPLKVDEKK